MSGPSAVLWVGGLISVAALGFAGSGLGALPKSKALGCQLYRYRRRVVTGCLLLAIANTLTSYGVRPTIIKDHFEAAADLAYDRWNSFSRITVSQNQTGPPSMFGASPRMPDSIVEQRALNIDVAEAKEFTVLLSPDTAAPSAMLEKIVSTTDRRGLDRATAGFYLDLTPPTDARPFFFNQLGFAKIFDPRVFSFYCAPD